MGRQLAPLHFQSARAEIQLRGCNFTVTNV
jgi:hypothetical protein